MAKKWQKTAIFSWNFDLFLTYLMDCGHIYVPKGNIWGSTSRPHIEDVVMSLFLLWCPPLIIGDGPKMVHLGPKMAKHGMLFNLSKWSKWDQNGQPKCFWPLGTLLGPSGPFWTISEKNDFLPEMDKVGFGRGASEQNINSCLKWSKRVQMGPKGSQMVKNT